MRIHKQLEKSVYLKIRSSLYVNGCRSMLDKAKHSTKSFVCGFYDIVLQLNSKVRLEYFKCRAYSMLNLTSRPMKSALSPLCELAITSARVEANPSPPELNYGQGATTPRAVQSLKKNFPNLIAIRGE